MATKSEQLQIRVTPREKAMIRRRADAAGVDVSTYVLSRALPGSSDRFADIVDAIRNEPDYRYALASLNDFLALLAPLEFAAAVGSVSLRGLSPLLQNYVAAMVEHAGMQRRVPAPAWVRDVESLEEPYFGAPLRSLRSYLLQVSPVAFKRRNIFIDASIGSRV